MNRTKIICTLGPSVDSDEAIIALVENGMSVVRLNCSHGDLAAHLKYLQRVRRVERKVKKPIAVMLDLQGPKIRVGDLPDPFCLHHGDIWQLSLKEAASEQKKIIPISFKDLPKSVKIGSAIFLDDGLIQTEVVKKSADSIWIKVIHGGMLESRKGINIPFYQGKLSVLSHKDKADLIWGLKHNVDFVALSFVRHAQDIKDLKSFIAKQKPNYLPLVIAKIEKPEAVAEMDDIIQVSDGILVARGDLGIELPPEKVPVVQKQLIERCRFFKKPLIVATQMLDSMRLHPVPTRAEVSDIANAIFSSADAALLTGETSSGKYPIEACAMMNKIITEVEDHLILKTFRKSPEDFDIKSPHEAFMFNVMQLADDIQAKAIVMLTKQGKLTKTLSKLHPKQPIFSLASDYTAYRQLNLYWGVFPIEISKKMIASRIASGLSILKRKEIIKKDDVLIFIYKDFKSENLNLKILTV